MELFPSFHIKPVIAIVDQVLAIQMLDVSKTSKCHIETRSWHARLTAKNQGVTGDM